MSKILLFSDIQIHPYKPFNQGDSRLKNCICCLEDILDQVLDRKIKTVFFPGDWFDTGRAVPTNALNRSVESLAYFFENGGQDVKIFGISGNHDFYGANLWENPSPSAMQIFAELFPDNFYLIDRGSYQLENKVAVHGVPYFSHLKDFWACVEDLQVNENYYNHLLVHNTPLGIIDKYIPTDFDPSDQRLKRFDRIWGGHIHRHQIIFKGYVMVGSPLHRTQDDIGQKKGYIVYDGKKGTWKQHYLKGYPEFQRKPLEQIMGTERNYIIPQIEVKQSKEEKTRAEDFDINLQAQEIIKNYFKVEGDDTNYTLKQGLKCLSKIT